MRTTRASIAAALNELSEVTATAKPPEVRLPGCAWPLVDMLVRGPATAFSCTWRVLVVLDGDEEKACDQLEELFPLVVDALRDELYIDSCTPIAVPTEAGDLFVAEFLGRSE